MKTFRTAFSLAILLVLGPAVLSAQDADIQSQEDYVLDQARAKLRASSTEVEDFWDQQEAKAADQDPAPGAVQPSTPAEPSTPRVIQGQPEASPSSPAPSATRSLTNETFVVELVPGLPFDYSGSRAILALGVIGSGLGAVEGAQVSSIFNLADQVKGFQGAGVFNISTGTVMGFQTAGVFNLSLGSLQGFQNAGVFNVAMGSLDGFQAAGVLNVAGTINGFQASGFLNIAQEVHGAQVGIINIATTSTGLGFGLLNLVGNGIHQLEWSWSDASVSRLGLKLGTPLNYTHFYADFHEEEIWMSRDNLVLGMGFGLRLATSSQDARDGGLYLDLEGGMKYHVGNQSWTWTQADCEAMHEPMSDEEASTMAQAWWEDNHQRFAVDTSATLGLRFGPHVGIFGGVNLTLATRAGEALGQAFQRGESFTAHFGDAQVDGRTRWFFGISL